MIESILMDLEKVNYDSLEICGHVYRLKSAIVDANIDVLSFKLLKSSKSSKSSNAMLLSRIQLNVDLIVSKMGGDLRRDKSFAVTLYNIFVLSSKINIVNVMASHQQQQPRLMDHVFAKAHEIATARMFDAKHPTRLKHLKHPKLVLAAMAYLGKCERKIMGSMSICDWRVVRVTWAINTLINDTFLVTPECSLTILSAIEFAFETPCMASELYVDLLEALLKLPLNARPADIVVATVMRTLSPNNMPQKSLALAMNAMCADTMHRCVDKTFANLAVAQAVDVLLVFSCVSGGQVQVTFWNS